MTQLVLNHFEHGFLKGDKDMWPCWGAAMSIVYEFCKDNGLGTMGEPTEKGRRLMDEFEKDHTL